MANACLSDRSVVIQEFIQGVEYGVDIVNDLKSNHVSVVIKEKLGMRAGETDRAKVVKEEGLFSLGKCIGENLKHIGNLDCDILKQGEDYYILDLNPRFGGGYPFSHAAGINVPKAIVAWLDGKPADPACFVYETGGTYSKCDEVLRRM